MSRTVHLVTHDGSFHADDVFSHAFLDMVFLRPGTMTELVRTRDLSRYLAMSIDRRVIFDVGVAFDPEKRVFDHHQKGSPLRDDGSPFSSFGLVWREYGLSFLVSDDGPVREFEGLEELDVLRIGTTVWQRVLDGLAFEIDQRDNGLGSTDFRAGHVSSLVEDMVPKGQVSDEEITQAFLKASEIAATLLRAHVAKLIAEQVSIETFGKSVDLETLDRVAILTRPTSWKRAVFDLELDDLLYVVQPKENGSTWYVSAVPPRIESFAQRKSLPVEWAGLSGEDLQRVTGVSDAVFCHSSRFICAAGSREGAIHLARIALVDPSDEWRDPGSGRSRLEILEEENLAYRRMFGCVACGEDHPTGVICPPHETRTSGQAWFRERIARAKSAGDGL